CSGTGAQKGTSPETCPDCQGRGQVSVQQRTPFGVISTSKECPKCNGKGKIVKSPCEKCKGIGMIRKAANIEVNIPAGIDDGQVMVDHRAICVLQSMLDLTRFLKEMDTMCGVM
ncbi:MAG: zinc finger domain-containing protein, partial [Oscillospiraceae bacterium]